MQFSLRTLLAAVAAVGIGAALWTAEPSWKVGAFEFLLLAWVPASAALLAAHSAGAARSWWIGITAESTLTTFIFFTHFVPLETLIFKNSSALYTGLFYVAFNISESFRTALKLWAFAPIVGLLCVLTHWLFIRSADPAEPKG